MRKIFLILSLFTTLFATAQTGSWTPISGNQRFTKGLGIPVKDTFSITRAEDSAQVVIRPQDSTMYYVYKGKWNRTATTGMLLGYLRLTGGNLTGPLTTTVSGAGVIAGLFNANSSTSIPVKAVNSAANGNLFIGNNGTNDVFTVDGYGTIYGGGLDIGTNFSGVYSGSFGNSNVNGNGVAINAASGTNYALNIRNYNSSAELFKVLGNGNASASGTFTADSIKKLGGTSSQFLKADGSLDNNTYLTSADISGKLNISDTAAMLSGYNLQRVTNLGSTTTQNITANSFLLPSSGNAITTDGSSMYIKAGNGNIYIGRDNVVKAEPDGKLSALSFIKSGGTSSQYLMADGSVSTLTNPVTGTGVSGRVTYWNGTGSVTSLSTFTFDGTTVGVPNLSANTDIVAGGVLKSNFAAGTGNRIAYLDAGGTIKRGTIDPADIATTSGLAGKLNISDTAAMLTYYLRNRTGLSDSYAIGNGSMLNATSGTRNIGLGSFSLQNNTDGGNNVAIGYEALKNGSSISNNTAIGYAAGSAAIPTDVENSVYLGYNSTPQAFSSVTNEIVIGASTTGNGSNTVTIGNSSITNNYFTGNVRGGAFIKSGGTSSQFLKADGSVDGNTYATTSSLGTYAYRSSGLAELSGATFTGTLASIGEIKSSSSGLITAEYSDISTGENRGLKLNNTGGANGIWNVTSGRTGVSNDEFVIRNAVNDINALVITPTTGAATFSSSVTAGSFVKSGGTSSQYLMADGSTSTLPEILKNSYTPTYSTGSNISSYTIYNCSYTKIGDAITVTGQLSVTPTTGGNITSFEMSFPLATGTSTASVFNGTGSAIDQGTNTPISTAIEKGTGDNMRFSFKAGTTLEAHLIKFTFTYQYVAP